MKASDEYLTLLLQGPKQFLIPIFQRTYSWTHTNCDQLFRDIVHAGKSNHIQSHFIGSLVLISSEHSSASISQWQVIDGQQRLTTITLLIAALLDRARELECDLIAETPTAAVREYYLANPYGQGEAKYKLLLTRSDKSALCALVDQKELPEDSSENVRRNYQYFYDAITDAEILNAAFCGLKKLKVVEVILQSGQDDPQAIFESLNSTGVDLTQADLIRNYVLMRQGHEEQTYLYNELWYPMERLFGNSYADKFDRFSQDLLTLKTGSNSLLKSRDVYMTFKHWFTETSRDLSVEGVLRELCRYSRYYVAFILGKEKDEQLKAAFSDLRSLVEVATPVVMRLYDLYEQHKFDKTDFIAGVRLLGSYVLRRSVCDMQTRSLGNIFAALAHKVSEESPLESLKVALARFSKNSRYPQDIEFQQALVNRDLYESRICRFVLDRLENDSKEKIDTTSFTIEHVLPQNPELCKEWREMLGDDWRELQGTWLHRLGNLTLTGYNSEYQDKPFAVKKAITGGFDDSPLRLNRDMRDADRWTDVEMAARGERLAKQAVELWPPLEIDPETVAKYVLADKKRQAEQFNVDDVGGLKDNTKQLFECLEQRVSSLGQDVSLIISRRNLTFYTLEGFVQAIPRVGYLGLILNLDFDELPAELQENCQRTSNWAFIANGDMQGVYCEFYGEEDIDWLMPLVNRAYEDALA